MNPFRDGGTPRFWCIDGVGVDLDNPTPAAMAVVKRLVRNAPKDASNSVECRPENFANPDFPGLSEKTTDD